VVREELVMERFRVLERIGSGGMGTVYRAFDERLQRSVAVKEVAAEPQRVLREAQAAARLNHPGIVTLYELGEVDGRALLVSELVPGETLDELLAGGLLADRDVAELGTDLCEALAHAHSRGVYHRDIKPQNVMVRHDHGHGRRAKLMDFGIARIAGAPTLTAVGEVVGTLAYMSPEQAEGEVAGAQSDVYSLALTLYECWAGVNPVAGRTPAETARRIGSHLTPLAEHRPDLPAPLTETIDCCLDPEPELRPDVLELRDGLEAQASELDAFEPLLAAGDPDTETDTHRPRRGGLMAALAAVAATLVVIAVPLGSAGLALVLAVLAAPSLLAGATLAGAAPILAPLLGATGAGAAAAVLGAVGHSPLGRAVLGAGAWIWLCVGTLIVGLGPDLGLAPDTPAGWTSDPRLAADALLAPLLDPQSLLGMGVFAIAAVALGWLLQLRHAAVALFGALLWAAGVDAALGQVANGTLGGDPLVLAVAACLAVAFEFGLLRASPAQERPEREGGPAGGLAPLGTRI
jgi:tRNA A-37 threonylcarbamoyl transferase component Bud32